MAKGGLLGEGVRVGFAVGTPHTWLSLESILDCKIPMLSSAKIDRTIHGVNRLKRNMAGLQDVSDMEIHMLRDPYKATSPNQNALYGYLANQASLYWRVEIPADADLSVTLYEAYEFQGRVGSFEPAAPIADKQTVLCKVYFDSDFFTHYEPMAGALSY